MTYRLVIAAVLYLLSTERAFALDRCSPSLPEDVCRLEETIYAHTDFSVTEDVRRAMVGLKEAYIAHAGDSSVIREHILGLVDHVIAEANETRAPKEILAEATGKHFLFPMDRKLAAFESSHGPVVPLDWQLPKGIRLLVFISDKHYEPVKDRAEFRVGLFGGMDKPGIVEELQVIHYPDEVVLDKSSRGGYSETVIGDERIPFFSLGASLGNTPVPEGLYLLNIKVKGQPKVSGWFLLSHATPTAAPVVKTPYLNEALHTARPVLRWLDFHSPEYRPFEHRKRILSLYRDEPSGPTWWLAEINPSDGEALSVGESAGLGKLQKGHYTFGVSFEERWLAGQGLFLGRKSATVVPFSVAAK